MRNELTEPDDSDEILRAFTYARDAAPADKTLLREWTARYPALADEIITVDHARLAAGMTLTDPLPDGPPDPEMAAVRARVLAARRAARASQAQSVKPPLTSLLADAETRGLDAADLAAALRLDRFLLGRLEDRTLDAATVPVSLAAQIAALLERTTGEITQFLRGGPRLPAAAHFLARQAPVVRSAPPQPSFADAVARSRNLSADDKAFWLAEAGAGVLGEVRSEHNL